MSEAGVTAAANTLVMFRSMAQHALDAGDEAEAQRLLDAARYVAGAIQKAELRRLITRLYPDFDWAAHDAAVEAEFKRLEGPDA